jgi:cellulose synthase/poly-beta-1,6-N-acetylglucosamine synthase-like glycosyltransferase
LISVVVVTLGERISELNSCIDALANQTVKDFEVVIIIPQEHKDAHLRDLNRSIPLSIYKQDGVGICNARNNGIMLSFGNIIAFTDDDAEPHPDWIEKINQHFEENPELDYIGGEFTIQVNNVWQRWIDHNYHLSEIDIDRGLCHGNNMAYRRKVFDNHRFDENIIFGADEADLQVRLKASGMKCLTFPDILIHHQHRSNFLSFTKMRWKYAQGHAYLYEEKYKQSLFHWDDLINIGFFASLFYAFLLCQVTLLLFIIPLALLILIFLHEKRSKYTIGTWIVQVYSTILWTLSKMYYSFKYHLRRWGINDSRLWVWLKA